MCPNGPTNRVNLHLYLSLMGLYSIIELLGKGASLRHALFKNLYILIKIMLITCSFKGEHLWLGVLSVNDERETVAGRVSNHPINRGLMFGQKIQIPIDFI